MDADDVLEHCLAMRGAWQDEPWEGTIVVKVGSRIFAFLGEPGSDSVGLKCADSRDEANEWLTRYPQDASVMAYLGRSGWNTLRVGAGIPDDEVLDAVDGSYAAVVSRLPRRERPL
ncbi:MAG: MmcQ/YjbR family DNA-binding protein [Actinobacteria bacterium]|jgi:predicted DNA-binding protein (MmcQ/YjbR family)|nr:MmcQ/YjbR family DNA-binding protein [Actinomycetota bacterium]